jgi:hypothetical protein
LKNLFLLSRYLLAILSLVSCAAMAASCTSVPGTILTAQPTTTELTREALVTRTPTPPPQATRDPSTPVGSGGDKIPFETVVRDYRLGTPLPDPALLLVVDKPGLETLDPLIDKDDLSLVSTVNFEEQALLAVFWGAKPAGGYSITITAVYTAGDELVVEVLLQDDDPEFPHIEAATSPYHVVMVDKNLIADKIVQFRMMGEDGLLASGKIR